jgi:hypothetical protein
VTTLLFYSEEDGLVIVCPLVQPGTDEVGETFWPVFYGGGFCGLSYSELRAAGKGTISVDERGRARILT